MLEKVVDEVINWFDCCQKDWVRQRHAELRAKGLKNREIYGVIRKELETVLVRPNPLSERQIRRIVYG